jgi:hypothetical protein
MRAMGFMIRMTFPTTIYCVEFCYIRSLVFTGNVENRSQSHVLAIGYLGRSRLRSSALASPPLTNKTIFQLLDEKQYLWKIYVTEFRSRASDISQFIRLLQCASGKDCRHPEYLK